MNALNNDFVRNHRDLKETSLETLSTVESKITHLEHLISVKELYLTDPRFGEKEADNLTRLIERNISDLRRSIYLDIDFLRKGLHDLHTIMRTFSQQTNE